MEISKIVCKIIETEQSWLLRAFFLLQGKAPEVCSTMNIFNRLLNYTLLKMLVKIVNLTLYIFTTIKMRKVNFLRKIYYIYYLNVTWRFLFNTKTSRQLHEQRKGLLFTLIGFSLVFFLFLASFYWGMFGHNKLQYI